MVKEVDGIKAMDVEELVAHECCGSGSFGKCRFGTNGEFRGNDGQQISKIVSIGMSFEHGNKVVKGRAMLPGRFGEGAKSHDRDEMLVLPKELF